ncbi:hypothetical protein CWC24_10650 [Pseudoalteromonas ruthenica]|nr:hypothetical protein CWC24_10650 [Pseudoalteromonas ruthenica]TMO51583.1 hypothetical protein CWC23_06565 [Pseudoalteromonas ruthenica]
MESILGSVIWRFFKWLPPFILRRIFSAEWMMKNIYIDIRPRHTSVEICQPDNPRVSIYLDIRNNTHFNVEIDRILLSFTYGTELANPQHFKREYLKPGESRTIYFTGNIDHSRFQGLAFQYQNNFRHCNLGILAECNTRLHKLCIERTLEGIKPEILNAHLLEAANKSSKMDAQTARASS